ncbi:MAG: hypothetical protein ACW99G_15990 [Candidatus Thorarchaeota archaeon]
MENDVREGINTISAENAGNLIGFNDAINAYAKNTLDNVDPSIRAQVELSIDAKVSNNRPRIAAAEAKEMERIANDENELAADGGRIDAVDAAYEGNGEAAAHAMAIATDSITQRTDIDSKAKKDAIRQLHTEVKEAQLSKSIDTVYESDGGDAATSMVDKLKKPAGMELSTWESFISSQRANVNRKDARKKAQEALDLKAGREQLKQYGTAKSLGFPVDATEEARLNNLISGTDLEKVKSVIDDTAQFSVMSAADRGAVLSSAETGKLDDVDTFASMVKAEQQINKMALEDGYTLGVKQGIVDQTPFDMNDPDTFNTRVEQSNILSEHYGVDVSPLSDSEVIGISASIAEMTPDEKIALATTFQSSPAIWGQLDKKNAGQFAMAGATGDTSVMTAVFKGQELLKAKLVKPLKQDDYLASFNDYVEGVYGTQDRRSVLDAVLSHYASTSSGALIGSVNASDFEASIDAVTGGISKINGYNVELPRGVDADDFDDFINDLQPETIAGMGGVANYSNDEAVEAIQQGRIRGIVGANQYIVVTNGGTLFGVDGRPFIFSYSLDAASTNSALSSSRNFNNRKELRSQ